jgi:hypothetical protein
MVLPMNIHQNQSLSAECRLYGEFGLTHPINTRSIGRLSHEKLAV